MQIYMLTEILVIVTTKYEPEKISEIHVRTYPRAVGGGVVNNNCVSDDQKIYGSYNHYFTIFMNECIMNQLHL